MRDTGFPRADAEADFLKVRRRQVLAQMAARLRGQHSGAGSLSFDEVVGALGGREERAVGLQVIPIDAIVGRAASLRMDAVVVETHKNWIDGSPLRSAEVSAQVLRRLLR